MYWIYVITHLASGKKYVGFTTRLPERLFDHKRGYGGSPKLTNSIRKYGASSFLCEVLEYGKDKNYGLTQRERHWINILQPEYNLTVGGEGLLGYKHTEATKQRIADAGKRPCSDETKARISISLIGKKRGPLSDQQRAQISKVHKFRKHTNEHNQRVSSALGQTYRITTPAGEKMIIKGLASFARQHSLSQSNLSNRGKSKSYLCQKITINTVTE